MVKGPRITCDLREKMLGAMKARYEQLDMTMNDPTKAAKAVLLPT